MNAEHRRLSLILALLAGLVGVGSGLVVDWRPEPVAFPPLVGREQVDIPHPDYLELVGASEWHQGAGAIGRFATRKHWRSNVADGSTTRTNR